MKRSICIGGKEIGDGFPVYIVGEIGINHNGDINTAKKLIDAAVDAGCDAVKFQKRTPEKCVPEEQKDLKRETPWGIITYMEYREKVEFGKEEYEIINEYCRQEKIHWFASCWDEDSVDFIEQFSPVCYKVASASLTDKKLLKYISGKKRPVILSTGMSTIGEIRDAVSVFNMENLLITHSTSSYPCKPEELNLRMILSLRKEFERPIGYSGHEVGLQTTVAAVALGACLVERHITLDRAMWGSDQAASVEPQGLNRLVRDIRSVKKALGDGVKKVYDSEKAVIKRLRKI